MDAIRRAFGGRSDARDEQRSKGVKTGQRSAYYDKVTQVSIPKYQMTKSGHVDYIVEVVKGGVTWQVARRYTQFKKLHADLTSLCPMTTPYHCEYGVVPVLCGSSWTEVTNQSIGLIEKRKWYLEVYLEQLLVRRNRFYQARTALYSFLHDNEVPVMKPGATPLPGFGAGGGKELKDTEKAKEKEKGQASQASPKDKAAAASSAASPAVAKPDGKPPTHADPQHIPNPNSSSVQVPRLSPDAEGVYASIASEQPSCASDPGPSYLSLLNTMDVKDRSGSMSPSHSAKVPQQVCEGCGKLEPVFDIDKWEEAAFCSVCQGVARWHLWEDDDEETKSTLDEVSGDAPRSEGAEPVASPTDSTAAATASASAAAATGALPGSENRPEWSENKQCDACGARFSFFLGRHHCRKCGGAFCGYCSPFTHALQELGYASEMRVCKPCKEGLLGGPSASGGDPGSSAAPLQPTEEFLKNSQALTASDFELVTTLGKGTFGKVMKVRHRQTSELYAMKVLSKKVVHKRRMVEYIREEKDILASINHPFIVHLYAAFQTDHNLYLLLEFLPGGELYSHIYSQGRFGEVDARFYCAEMALAIGYLHSKDIVHRDIKPENIVLDREGHAVLTDFGLAKKDFSQVTRRSFVGSSEYLAPETVKGGSQTKAVDWWSLGVLLYEMLVGSAPFNGTNNNDVYQQILHKELSYDKLKSPASVSILKNLLCRDVAQRLAHVEDIKDHPFFQPINWELLEQKKVTPPFVPDLEMNDTRYFAKEFTHEWANLEEERAGKHTLDLLCQKFDNFPVEQAKPDDADETRASSTAAANAYMWDAEISPADEELGLTTALTAGLTTALTSCSDIECGTPGDSVLGLLKEPSTLDPPHILVGVWSLRSLEMVTEAGKVSYPWGSEVVGQAVYTSNGLFSLECTQTRGNRAKFRDADYTKVTRDEMAEAYLTYVSSFGFYTCSAGEKFVTHHCVGSLCPNWSEAEQKRYYRFIDGSGSPNGNYLVLATGQIIIDGMPARTVMKFQRLDDSPDLPDFMKRRKKRAEEAAAAAAIAAAEGKSDLIPLSAETLT